MPDDKKDASSKTGFRETTVAEFLDLTPADNLIVEMRLRLARELRNARKAQNTTQAELADRRKTSQSRISALERGDESVTLDALISALAELGVSRQDIGRIIAA